MAVTSKKRKRPQEAEISERNEADEQEDEAAFRARFQRAFEANFKPLKNRPKREEPHTMIPATADSAEDLISEDEAWNGLSDADDKVVQFQALDSSGNQDREFDMKSFMSSKPPTSKQPTKQSSSKATTEQSKEDGLEAANLKNDLALQRLLKESHLLEPASTRLSASAPEGKNRLKALDLRIQDLGGKQSHLEQEKMPLSHRRGIQVKSAEREQRRRSEAAENGIILERMKGAAKVSKARDRSVGGPNVGKFKGGTLKLSGKDVRSIQGADLSKGKLGKGRRR